MAAVSCQRYVPFAVRAARDWLLVALAIALLPAGSSSAEEPVESTWGGAPQSFRWFQSLGYPDVAKAQFVLVTHGQGTDNGEESPPASREYGFLLSDTEDRFSILTATLLTQEFAKAGRTTEPDPAVPEPQVASFAAADLVKVATATLDEFRASKKLPEEAQVVRRFGARISEPAALFILAWACSRQGHDELAASLFDCAKQVPEKARRWKAEPRSLVDRVAEDIAHAEMWQAVLAFGDPSISRQQLYEWLTRIAKIFPGSKHVDQAKATATLLVMMIAEDRAHTNRQPGDPQWEQLDRKQQIAELIFQLRDQNGQQFVQPGSCDIFWPPGAGKDTPAHRLVEIGYDAVPQLIDALSDPRPTRSVGFHRNFYFSHYVLTVGDCALQVLEQIAGRSFYTAKHTAGYMSKDGQTQTVEKEVRAWYAEFLAKGEKQTLLDATARGDNNSARQGERLVKKYPDDALPALIAGAQAAKSGWVRPSMIHLIGGLPGEQPQAFLLAQLKEGDSPAARLEAARIFHRRGRPEAVTALIERWKQLQIPAPSNPLVPGAAGFDHSDRASVAGFLARSGRVEAIEALADGFANLPVELRLTIVSALGQTRTVNIVATGAGGEFAPPESEVQADNDPKLRAAVLKLLIAALDDAHPREGLGGNWNGISISNPRICDIAGAVLTQLDAERFPFDLAASLAERDRSRVILKNVWLKEQGKPELPLPAPVTP